MKKYKITIDMDEVLCHFMPKLVELYSIDISEVTSWNIDKHMPGATETISIPGFYYDLKPLDGAVDGMKKLIEDGHDVVITTASPKSSRYAYEDKREWVMKYLPFFDMNNFISAHRKDLIGCDIMFDDGPHNIASFKGKTVLMKRPWNDNVVDIADHVVESWEEFLAIVDEMSRKNVFVDLLDMNKAIARSTWKARNMTFEEAHAALISAGIIDKEGRLTKRYGGK